MAAIKRKSPKTKKTVTPPASHAVHATHERWNHNVDATDEDIGVSALVRRQRVRGGIEHLGVWSRGVMVQH